MEWLTHYLKQSRQRIQRQGRLLGPAVLVGVVAGLAAVVFLIVGNLVEYVALTKVAGYRPPPPAGDPRLAWLPDTVVSLRPWLLVLVPTVGGLLTGLLVAYLAPEAEGHGTDAVIRSYHHEQGQMRPRVPLVKIIASAITLGTGGSGGREGPIAQVGAGFGSFLANLLGLRPAERRILLAAGMGAGIAAIFHAPLAGALFAAEVLYRSADFESDVIIPAGIASVVAYSTFGLFFGWEPLFAMPPSLQGQLSFNPLQLGPYFLLALVMIVLAAIYVRSFYGLRDLFQQLRMPRFLKPAVGAGLTGAVALGLYYGFGENEQVLGVLSFGYGVLQAALQHEAELSAGVLVAVALGKILTTGLTIGSGGSAGVFGASMVIGGCAGGALGLLFQSLWPALVPHPTSFVVVGMAGFFAAAAKTPFSTLVMVGEMTGNYDLLLPSLWVCLLAFLFSDQKSIYSEQVETRAQSPAHRGGFIHEVLSGVRVGQLLASDQAAPLLLDTDTLTTAVERLRGTDHLVLPVVDADGHLLGVVGLEEVHHGDDPLIPAARFLRRPVIPLRLDDRLDRAVELFVENDLPALPVVDGDGGKVVGIVRRSEVASAYLDQVHERITC